MSGLDYIWLAGGVVLLFLAVLGVASLFDRQRRLREFWSLSYVQLIIIVAVLLPVYLGGIYLLIACLLVALRMLWEGFSVAQINPNRADSLLVVFGVCLALMIQGEAITGRQEQILVLLIFASQAAVVFIVHSLRHYLVLLGIAVACALPLSALLYLGRYEQGFSWIFLLYLVVEMNDSAAALIGRFAGTHAVFPVISPNKTWEGLLGGLAVSCAIGGVAVSYVLHLPWVVGLLFSLVVGLVGIGGDLAISALKRYRSIKDFPALHEKLGGIIDINDAFFSVVTVAAAYILLMSYFPSLAFFT